MNRLKLVSVALLCVAIALFAPHGVVLSAPGETERVSVGNTGNQGAHQSLTPAVSGDGRFVAFESYAALIPEDTNGQLDIYVRDRQTDKTVLVSISSTGELANSYSYKPVLNANGRFVAFSSSATNLVPGGVYAGTHLYVRDRDTDGDGIFDEPDAVATVRLDSPLVEDRARAGPSHNPSISADGRFVAFESAARGLVPGDTNNQTDIFVRDRDLDENGIFDEPGASVTFRVNLGPDHEEADDTSNNPAISDDGRFVAFDSVATNLAINDLNEVSDVFLYDRQTHATTRLSAGRTRADPDSNGESGFPSISGDGQLIAFHSRATNLIANDTNLHFDIFVYDRMTGQRRRVSVSTLGSQANHGSLYPSISRDGNYVAFTSNASNLVTGDGGARDIFVHKRDTAVTVLASTDVAGASANGHSDSSSINQDGTVVAFQSHASDLVPNDTNAVADIFAHEPDYPPPPQPGTADVAVTGSVEIGHAPGGQHIKARFQVVNHGPERASIRVNVNVPANTTFVSCSHFCEGTASARTYRLLIEPEDFRDLTLELRVNDWVPNGTPFEITAEATSTTTDPNSSNNSATVTVSTPQAAKRPLIFVPGVGGTRLRNDQGEQWIALVRALTSRDDPHLLTLRLAPDGSSPYASEPQYTSMRAGDIIRDELGTDVYKTTIEDLTARGYQERVDLFPFPYDWRKDSEAAGQQLIAFIDQVLAQTGADKVDIMAHSMGSVVTLTALHDSASVGKVRKVLTLGAPYLGATKALGMIEFRAPCFLDGLPFCPFNEATLQETLRNLPGPYQLMPSRNFDQAVGPPLDIDSPMDEKLALSEGPQRYDQWTGLVKRNRNAALVTRADALHQDVDSFNPADSSVQLQRYIGTSLNTPYQLRIYEWCFLWIFFCSPSVEIINGSGDGTVPDNSADLHNPATGFDLRNGAANRYWRDISHAELPIHEGVLASAYDYFNNPPTQPPDTEEEPLDGIEIEIVRPINGHIIDPDDPAAPRSMAAQAPQDNHTPFPNLLGRNAPGWHPDVVWETLPGGHFNEFSVELDGEVYQTRSFFLNNPGTYRAALQVEESRPGRVRVRSYTNDAITGQAVFLVDAPAGATLQLDFATGQDLSTLTLTLDGDGPGPGSSETVRPISTVEGTAADDHEPPVTTASATSNGDGTMTVTLSVQDEPGGSGVAETYYQIIGTHDAPQRYTTPFRLPAGQTVQFASSDRAGNTETIKEFPTEQTTRAVYLPLIRR